MGSAIDSFQFALNMTRFLFFPFRYYSFRPFIIVVPCLVSKLHRFGRGKSFSVNNLQARRSAHNVALLFVYKIIALCIVVRS